MGKSKVETSYLATPPSSTFLRPRSDESMPELNLGPANSSRQRSQSAHDTTAVYSHDLSSSCSPPSVRQAVLIASEGKGLAKRSKPTRKTTHSQIEKRRREKINDTMQRLKDLVPACHAPDALLRKLDVLTATADYIEHLHEMLTQEGQCEKKKNKSLTIKADGDGKQDCPHRGNSKCADLSSVSSDAAEVLYRNSAYQSPLASPASPTSSTAKDDAVDAAQSLIQIAASPMLRPVVERHRLSISELMHL